jgi:hypothetical protein
MLSYDAPHEALLQTEATEDFAEQATHAAVQENEPTQAEALSALSAPKVLSAEALRMKSDLSDAERELKKTAKALAPVPPVSPVPVPPTPTKAPAPPGKAAVQAAAKQEIAEAEQADPALGSKSISQAAAKDAAAITHDEKIMFPAANTMWDAVSCSEGNGSVACGIDMYAGTIVFLLGLIVIVLRLTYRAPAATGYQPSSSWSIVTLILGLIIAILNLYLLVEDRDSPSLSHVHLIFADVYVLLPWLFLMLIAVMDLERLPQYRVVEWQVVSLLYAIPRLVWCCMDINQPNERQSEDTTLVAVRLAMLCALTLSGVTSVIQICNGLTVTPNAQDTSGESDGLLKNCGRNTAACGGRPAPIRPPELQPKETKRCGPICCAPKRSQETLA